MGILINEPVAPPDAPPETLLTFGDPIECSWIVPGGDGAVTWDGKNTCSVKWRLKCYRPDAYPAQLAASTWLPQRGDPLRAYRPALGGYVAGSVKNYLEFPIIAPVDAALTLSSWSFSQQTDDPFVWEATAHYATEGDPLALPAEFHTDDVMYQEVVNLDVYGRPVDNSAFDLMLSGMTVDRNSKYIKLVRNLPYSSWDCRRGEPFRNTLNKEPFVVSRQRDASNNPVILPPGSCRLMTISEQEVLRSPHPAAGGRQWYWRVMAQIHVDLREVRQPSGLMYPVRHRFAYVDAGFRTLDKARKRKVPIFDGPVPVTEPQLLDLEGRQLRTGAASGSGVSGFDPRPERPSGWVGGWPSGSLNPRCENSEWEIAKGGTLTVPSPGVLLTAYDVDVTAAVYTSPTHGTLSLASDGGFTYTPSAGHSGWDWFAFKPSKGEQEGTPVVVFVQTRAQAGAWWQFRSRYETKSWTPISALLVGW